MIRNVYSCQSINLQIRWGNRNWVTLLTNNWIKPPLDFPLKGKAINDSSLFDNSQRPTIIFPLKKQNQLFEINLLDCFVSQWYVKVDIDSEKTKSEFDSSILPKLYRTQNKYKILKLTTQTLFVTFV